MKTLFALFVSAAILLAGCAAPASKGPTAETVVLSYPRGDFADPGPVADECLGYANTYPQNNRKFVACSVAESKVGRSDAECKNGLSPAGCSICTLSCTLASPGGNSGAIPPKNETSMPNATATLAELVGSPEKYLNKTVIVDASVLLEGNMFQGGNFSLEDGNTSVRVNAWAPFSVAQCQPNVDKCSPPQAMPYYIGKIVRATGKFEAHMESIYNRTSQAWGKEYQDGYQIHVDTAQILD